MNYKKQIIFEKNETVSFIEEFKFKYESSITRKFLRNKNKLFHNIPERKQMAVYADDYVSNKILSYGVYEKSQLELIIAWLKEKEDVFESKVIDIGANIGNHSLYFSQFFSECISFEPNPRTFSLLDINSKLVQNITPMNMGLSDKKSTAVLYTNFGNVGASSLTEDWNKEDNGSCYVQLERIDDVIGEGVSIGLIKMDVEGHEWYALKGGEKTIKKNKPIIIFEHNGESEDNEKDVISLLRHYGYDKFYEVVDGWEYLAVYLSRYPKPLRFLIKALFFLRGKEISHRIIQVLSFEKKQYPLIIAKVE